MAKDIIITPADGDIVFDNSSGAECGAITQDGDNLVISNAVGDVLIGDGASDIYIGDGTNNVDILFEQSGNIKAEDGSTGVTLTIGSSDTTLALGSPISSDLTVGVNDTGHDVKFFGATAGSYMLWDQSEDGLQIIHPTGDAGLEVYTVSQGAPNSPQFKVGRASTEYWGVYTEDRTAHLIHRQDETDSDAMNTSFELWGGGSGNDYWAWKHGTNTGGSLATVMTLDKAGLLTVTGNISSSTNIYAADYFDNGVNINTIYQPTLTFGIADTNVLRANANVADNDFLRVDGTSIEGRTAAQVLSDIGAASTDALLAQSTPTDGAFLIADDGRSMVDSVLSQAGTVVSSTGHISSSTNIYAADYFDNGANINTIYSPIANPTFTGTVAIPNISNVSASIAANTAKATNVSTNLTATTDVSQITINSSDGDNVVIAEASDTIAGVMTVAHHDKLDGIEASADVTDATNVTAAGALMDSELTDLAGVKGVTISTLQVKPSEGAFANGDKTKLDAIEASATADQTQADINGLAITTVGALGSGTISSGFGNIDNGTSTINTGEITATSIKHSISGNNAGDYGPGAEILYGISSETTTAGAIYTLRAGVWTLIDANTDNRVDRLCAVAVGTNSSTSGMLIRGCVTLASVFTAGTDIEGVQVYASETAGQATIDAPSDSTDLVRILGYSLNVSAKKMFFNPDSTFLEIA